MDVWNHSCHLHAPERNNTMKPLTGIRLLFLLLLLLSLTGCGNTEKKQVKNAVVSGFEQLKDLDPGTVQEYLASESLFPNASTSQASPDIIEETASQFFKDFDYDIQKVHIRDNRATCTLKITSLDATALARDYQETYLVQVIMATANGQAFTDTSLEQHYIMLNELMRQNTYDTVSSSCDIHLIKTENKWAIQKDRDLENKLVGGFLSVIANPYLLTPTETLDIYFRTIKSMDTGQMASYMGLTDTLTYSDDTSQALAEALIRQVHTCFNYRVSGARDNGTTATVNTEITSFSSKEILARYQAGLDEYLATPKALIDGVEGRLKKSNELLIQCITDNTATQSQSVSLSMVNDGVGWKLLSNDQLGTALFGDFSTDLGASSLPTTSEDSGS